jgi:hypothetical protein
MVGASSSPFATVRGVSPPPNSPSLEHRLTIIDALEKIGVIPVARMDVDSTADSLPSSPNVKLEDVDEDDRSVTQPLDAFDEDDRSVTQPLDRSPSPDAAEKASDGTKIKRERDV